jgi:hypothetical protein
MKCYDYFHGNEQVPDVCAGLKCLLNSRPAGIKIYEPFLNKFLDIRATPLYGANKKPIGVFHIAREMQPRPAAEENNMDVINVVPTF